MDILPKLLGETEFNEFTPEDYDAFRGVLNDTLSLYILKYTENESANEYIVDCINNFLGPTIESLTFHNKIQEMGIYDLVMNLVPASLLTSHVDLNDIIYKLQFLEDNKSKLRTTLPKRTRQDWNNFTRAVDRVLNQLYMKHIEPTYPNIMERLEANKFIFYKPNAPIVKTDADKIIRSDQRYNTCLHGAKFLVYCNQNSIAEVNRRMF